MALHLISGKDQTGWATRCVLTVGELKLDEKDEPYIQLILHAAAVAKIFVH